MAVAESHALASGAVATPTDDGTPASQHDLDLATRLEEANVARRFAEQKAAKLQRELDMEKREHTLTTSKLSMLLHKRGQGGGSDAEVHGLRQRVSVLERELAAARSAAASAAPAVQPQPPQQAAARRAKVPLDLTRESRSAQITPPEVAASACKNRPAAAPLPHSKPCIDVAAANSAGAKRRLDVPVVGVPHGYAPGAILVQPPKRARSSGSSSNSSDL